LKLQGHGAPYDSARAAEVTDSAAKARILGLLVERYPPQPNLAEPCPPPDSIAVFKLTPIVISVLDYSKGFGHTDLVWP
jgi:hypothetical protein